MKGSQMKQVRKIIAEDPEWNLETVPGLNELCVKHIVQNFADQPLLEELLPHDKNHVLKNLSVTVPIRITANLIVDESYWKRCCKARWEICDVSTYENSWRRMYFEKDLEEKIEKFVPGTSNANEIPELLKLYGQYIKRLNIRNLLPPVKEVPKTGDEELSDNESDAGEALQYDHFDFNVTVSMIPNLEELHICYGVRNCGMEFEWNLFEFTKRDCSMLAKAVKSCSTLQLFHLHKSKVNDEQARVLISHILDHPALTVLDFSYNKLSDSSARALGKLLNNHSKLVTLDLTDNKIGAQGAAAIGHALGKNTTLKTLNLRLNSLEDGGFQAILRSLLKNNTLNDVHLGSNNITKDSAPLFAQVLVYNKSLRSLNVSCNKLGEESGKAIQEAMEDNDNITKMDLRLTDIGQECEYNISQLLKKNRELLRKK